MSRTLSKILVICALVAVFPLMIVGTVFASYFSVEASVTVEVQIDSYSDAADAYARIDCGNETLAIEKVGKSEKKAEITKGHLSEVSLSANSKGYTFEGWFVGDSKAYAVAHQNGTAELIKNEDLKFVITDYENLTAVFNIVEYTIGYNYKPTPVDAATTVAPTDGEGNSLTTFNYGEKLPELTYEGLSHKFGGWKLVGDESEKLYDVAIFESSKDIVLEAIWIEQPKFEVKYFDAPNTEAWETVSNVYAGTDYDVLAIEEVVPAARIKAGYAYAWQDENGNTINDSYTINGNFNLYLKEQEIKYSAKLIADGAVFNGHVEAEFGIKSYSSLQAWFNAENWSVEPSYNQVSGLKFGETTYSFDETGLAGFVTAVVDANPTATPESAVEISVIVDKYFTTFKVTNGVTFITTGVDKNVYLFDDIGVIPFSLPGTKTISDTSKTLYEVLNLKNEGEMVKLYNANGTEVELSSININGVQIVGLSGDTTVAELIEKLYKATDAKSDTFTVESMEIHFVAVA